MRCAICDDETIDIQPIEAFLQARHHDVDLYDSGEALLAAYKKAGVRYDALFLDMEMNALNGFDTANAIYAIDDSVLVVFVTSHDQYVFECFKCNPVWFLRKPVQESALTDAVQALEKRLTSQRRAFTFSDSRQSVRMRLDDILYVESLDHQLTLHTKTGDTYTLRRTIKDLADELGSDQFCRIHKSYLVNLEYVIGIVGDAVVMQHGQEQLPVGRTYKQSANAAFLAYKKERVRG